MSQPLFALIDCNNFFVSCEQIFRPDLLGKPVVVLSSNDGCVVARSREARAIGIPMAAAAFKYKQLFQEHGVVKFGANFELYGDISRRITEILTSITPRLEVYSIDESFLDISQLDIPDYTAWAAMVRGKILQWTGISVSVGIAPTKTLAKLASERAKKDDSLNGVLSLHNLPKTIFEQHLAAVALEDIWGVGRRMAPRLRIHSLASALDIAGLTPQAGRQLFGSVMGERLVRELQGQCCLRLERVQTGQHSISATRTFGEQVDRAHVVEAAFATFATRAAHRLRSHHQRARRLAIFLATNKHKPNYQRWGKDIRLPAATADTGTLVHAANQLFGQIFQPNAHYYRAGILLYDLEDDRNLQPDLLGTINVPAYERSQRRMKAVDHLNDQYGRRMIHYASEDLGGTWRPRQNIKSPHYVTNWQELPRVSIKG
jgi:DNA polymerase V